MERVDVVNPECTMDTAKRMIATGKAEFRMERGQMIRKLMSGKWYYILHRYDKGGTQLVRVPKVEEA